MRSTRLTPDDSLRVTGKPNHEGVEFSVGSVSSINSVTVDKRLFICEYREKISPHNTIRIFLCFVYEKVNKLLAKQLMGEIIFRVLELSLEEADKQIDGFYAFVKN